MPADTELILGEGGPWTTVPLSRQQVSPWPFKGLASGTKKAERCCFKPLQALQILSCCFLTGPTQPSTACLTLWLLMSESTCALRLSSPLPFPPLSLPLFSLHVISLTSKDELKEGERKEAGLCFLCSTHRNNISDLHALSFYWFIFLPEIFLFLSMR